MLKITDKANISIYKIEFDNVPNAEYIATVLYAGKAPLVFYNGIVIPHSYISSFYLESEGFYPTLKMFFYDQIDEMKSEGFASDNTVISIYIDSRTKDSGGSPVLRPIRMDFKIVDFGYLEDEKLFFIKGVPNIDGLFIQRIQSYKDKTSLTVMKEIAKSLKLGFSTNVDTSDDKMNWLNPGLEVSEFIQDVASKSYKDDSSFFISFVDYYYNLNFVDVETQLKDDINQEKGVMTSNDISLDPSKSQFVDDLYLISDSFAKSSVNNTFESYQVLNKSTKISLKNGYRVEMYYYDKTGNWNEKAGTFIKFTIETNTDGKGIILKSFPQDNTNDGFFKSNTKKLDLTPLDIDNTHKHYNYATILNQYNLDEINKVKIVLTLKSPNFNFYKYQKIKVIIYEPRIDKSGQQFINQRLSGGWLITGINFRYTPEDGLKQEITMIKRELTTKNFDY